MTDFIKRIFHNIKNKTPAEKAKEHGVPLIPKKSPNDLWKPININPDPNPVVSVCGECGLEIRKIMHYSCKNIDCPAQEKLY
jgi:hypothetical protein